MIGNSKQRGSRDTTSRLALALLVVVALLGALLGNGAERPLEEHEVFVARTAIEMQRNGDWLVPQFNAEPRLEKPPLAYWTAVAAHKLVGARGTNEVDEFTARLSSALAGVALIAITWSLARATFRDRRAAFAAAAMWATTAGFFRYTHNARPEMLYALFTASSMLGFVRLANGDGRPIANALLAWASFALAMLTKGPFFPLFAVVGVILAILVQRRRQRESISLAANLRPWLGATLVLITSVAYFAYVAFRVPGALEFWREQMFHRTAVAGESSALAELLTLPYLLSTPSILAPWLVFIPLAAVLAWRTRLLVVRYQAFAFVVALVCLSFSRNGHGYYTLPVLPFACSLMGGAAVEWLDRQRASQDGAIKIARMLAAHIAIAVLAAICIAAAVFTDFARPTPIGRGACVVLATCALLAAGVAWRSRARVEWSFATLVLSMSLSIAATAAANVGWEPNRYTRADFAKNVAQLVPATLPIASTDGARELLIYYGDRRVPEITYRELPDFLAAHPGALLMSRRDKLAARNIAAREVLAEAAPPDRYPLVLVEITPPQR